MKEALGKTWKNIKTSIPIMAGILMLVSLLNPLLQNYYSRIFTGNYFLDPLIGAIAGSISFGIPIVGYVTGGELLHEGVSLLAVTAFILAWTTVGVAMLPLEAAYFGRRFALVRNALNFVWSIIIAVVTVSLLKIFL